MISEKITIPVGAEIQALFSLTSMDRAIERIIATRKEQIKKPTMTDEEYVAYILREVDAVQTFAKTYQRAIKEVK